MKAAPSWVSLLRRTPRRAWAAACCLVLVALPAYGSGQLEAIRQRGVLVVGVKTDYPPFGMLSSAAVQEGFEHDLAADLAARLGVQLRTVGVSSTNRLQVLDDGRVDVTIATLGDTAERRQIATLVEPDYYSSGVALMTRPDSNLQHWSELRGQTVCAIQGSYFNRTMALRYLLNLQIYANGRDAKMAVRDARCRGWLFDNTAIAGDLLSPEWHDYQIRLPPELMTPWAIAIARSERGGALERLVGDTVAQWHRQGTLLALERKWGLPPSPFLAQMQVLWNEKDADGRYLCRRQADGQWPVVCRNQIFVMSADVVGLRRWGLRLYEKTGINLTYIYDDYERREFLHGIAMTLALTFSCVTGSLLLGIALAWLALRTPPAIGAAVRSVALAMRMTPPLLQIYVLLFGVGSAVAARWGLQFSAFWIVVLCLSAYTGSGLMHILDNEAREAWRSTPGLVLDLPGLLHLMGRSSASVTASLVNVAKATMIASAVAVPELLSVSTSIIAEHGNVATMMNTLMLFFVLLIFGVLHVLRRLQSRGDHERA